VGGGDVATLVLTGRSADVLARFSEPLSALSEEERARAAAIRFEGDRDSMVAAHLLARMCAAWVLGTSVGDLTIEQHCSSCARPHGRPTVVQAPELAVSWSHTRGHVAATAGAGPLGIDIEALPGRNSDALPRRVLAPAEVRWMLAAADPQAAFLSLWVRKEALIKVGLLTLGTLSTVDLIGPAGELAETWDGLRFTGWSRGPVIGACATPQPAGLPSVQHLH